MTCRDCGGEPTVYVSPLDACPLCPECAEREIIGLLEGIDQEDLTKIRRRVEDCIRKNPQALMWAATRLAARGQVKIIDLL